jgi:hypothetical protein
MQHHYMPEFFLKQWAGADRRLCEYRRWPGRITRKRTHPGATGYVVDLYKIDGAAEEVAHQFESIFMSGIDNDASDALARLRSGDRSPWSSRMRSGWTRFIVSMIYRNPETVVLLKRLMLDISEAAKENTRDNYAALRGPDDPPTFDEAALRIRPDGAYFAALLLLKDIVNGERLGERIYKMNWSMVHLGRTSTSLLVSDRPLDRPTGLTQPDAYIALPIGPKSLFVAEHGTRWVSEFADADPSRVAKAFNQASVHRGRNFVWGADDSHLRFVQNRLSKGRDYRILTDDQMRRVVHAARWRKPDIAAARAYEEALGLSAPAEEFFVDTSGLSKA